ncbi:MAG: hypothetical protein ACPGO3_09040 [Magnetospiraceae bacterium]
MAVAFCLFGAGQGLALAAPNAGIDKAPTSREVENLIELGTWQEHQGLLDAAESSFLEAVVLQRSLVAVDPTLKPPRRQLATVLRHAARVLTARQEFERAAPLLEESLVTALRTKALFNVDPEDARNLALGYEMKARQFERENDPDQAEQALLLSARYSLDWVASEVYNPETHFHAAAVHIEALEKGRLSVTHVKFAEISLELLALFNADPARRAALEARFAPYRRLTEDGYEPELLWGTFLNMFSGSPIP